MLSFLSYIHPGLSPGSLRKLSQTIDYCFHPCYASNINFTCYICHCYFCFNHFEHLLNWSYLRSVWLYKPQPHFIFLLIALVNFDMWMDALSTTMQGRDRLSSDASSQHLSSNFRKIQNFIESPVFERIIANLSPLLVVPSIILAFPLYKILMMVQFSPFGSNEYSCFKALSKLHSSAFIMTSLPRSILRTSEQNNLLVKLAFVWAYLDGLDDSLCTSIEVLLW